MFYTNGSFEYWGRAAALIHTSVDGKKDVASGSDTRGSTTSPGTQHGPNARPERTVTQNRANPADYRFVMRALLGGDERLDQRRARRRPNRRSRRSARTSWSKWAR